MPVTAAEVAELRAAGEALPLDFSDYDPLRTDAEIIGYLIHTVRAAGAGRAEQLDTVEMLVRSTGMWAENVCAARDVLSRLGFGADLSRLLTKLARRAPAKPRWIDRMRSRHGSPDHAPSPVSRPVSEVALAVELLRPSSHKSRR